MMKKHILLLVAIVSLAVVPSFAQDSAIADADTVLSSLDPASAPVGAVDTLIVQPGPVVVTESEKRSLDLFGYLIVAFVLVGTVFSDKLRENGAKWSSTLLGVLAALKLLVDSALAGGGVGDIRPEAVGAAVVLACLGVLAPSLLDTFPWLRGLVTGLFKKK